MSLRTSARTVVVSTVITLLASVTLTLPGMPAAQALAPGHAGFALGGGIVWQSDAEIARTLDEVVNSGAKWVRFDFSWAALEPQRGTFNWAPIDRVVTASRNRGLDILGLLSYTPTWARPAGTDDFYPPTSPTDFANFAAAATSRYTPRIKVWEVWNEPNAAWFWKPAPNAAAYTALLKAAYPAIKAADPTAMVLSAGLAPSIDLADGTQIAPETYLRSIYAAGGRGYFDAFNVHPYSFPFMPSDSTSVWNAWVKMPLFHDIMVANGDGAKKIWSTEFGAPTGNGWRSVTEDTQVAIMNEAFSQIANWSWAGPLLWYSLRDSGTNVGDLEQNFGLLRYDSSPKPAWNTFRSAMGLNRSPAVSSTTTTVAPTTTTLNAPTTTTTVRRTTTTTVKRLTAYCSARLRYGLRCSI